MDSENCTMDIFFFEIERTFVKKKLKKEHDFNQIESNIFFLNYNKESYFEITISI